MKKQFGKSMVFASVLMVAACGGEEKKAKISIDEGDGKSGSFDESISLAGSGNFQELQVINTPHPYRNGYSRTWQVTGSADATELKISFTRFETETGYDFVTVTDGDGGQRTQHAGNKSGTDIIVIGNKAIITFRTDTSVTGWGARMVVSERLPCACQLIHDPVCGEDGNTYPNTCHASCENIAVAYEGSCANNWIPVD